jgi:5-methylcytosine-specific restriction endonuclease McrA
MSDQLDVVERLLQILHEGQRSSTYKLAVIIGLLDLCLARTDALGWPPTAITTRELAERVIELYWPQVRPRADVPLSQNRGREGVILREVRQLRDQALLLSRVGASVHRVRTLLPDTYEATVDEVEWKLIEMPLPRLQRVGGQDTDWLYRIGWADNRLPSRGDVRRYQRGEGGDFDNRILLRPDVALAFVRLHGLLRPFVEQRWVREVAEMNRLPVQELHGFLFGAPRTALAPVRPLLLDLQGGDCFYCGGRIAHQHAEVDHFIPWARHPDDGLENLVVAHRRCNGSKSDFLASVDHLARWRARNLDHACALEQIADDARWGKSGTRALGAARALYMRLPAEARLWRAVDDFELIDPRRVGAVLE